MPLPAPPPLANLPPPQNYVENNREYHGFHKGKYMFPCDEVSGPIRRLLQWPVLEFFGVLANAGDFTARDGSHGYLP